MHVNPFLLQGLAYCRVTAATGAATTARNCATARTGAGVYTVTIDYACDEEGCIVLFESQTAACDDVPAVTHTSDTVKQIETFDGGVATDCDFAAIVLKCV